MLINRDRCDDIFKDSDNNKVEDNDQLVVNTKLSFKNYMLLKGSK